MKITVLGCGNAFSKKNFNQCFMLDDYDSINEKSRRMLIDFGSKIPAALDYHSINIDSITDVYISHLHGDHVGGLEELAFARYDWYRKPTHCTHGAGSEGYKTPVNLIGNRKLLDDWWEKTARGGLESMEGFVADAWTWFNVQGVNDNSWFRWCEWKCTLIQQIHVMSGSMIMSTFGLLMEKDGHDSVYFTADSQHCSPKQMEVFYKRADLILQDCECIGVDTSQIDRSNGMLIESSSKFSSGVHANYAQLAGYPSANSVKLSDEIRAKMWLSHYQDFVNDDKDFFGNDCDWAKLAEQDGFAGFVELGKEFDV